MMDCGFGWFRGFTAALSRSPNNRNSTPILTKKNAERGKANADANGRAGKDPFLGFATAGTGAPIDVEARLAAMKYQGAGDSAIHITQLEVSASLLSRGVPIDEVVQTIFDATCTAAGAAGNSWSWSRERQAIEKMCLDWLTKHPEIGEEKPAEPPPRAKDPPETGAVLKAPAPPRSKSPGSPWASSACSPASPTRAKGKSSQTWQPGSHAASRGLAVKVSLPSASCCRPRTIPAILSCHASPPPEPTSTASK